MKNLILFLLLLVTLSLTAQDKSSRIASPQAVDNLTLSLPLDRSVYQKDAGNKASIRLAGQIGIIGFTNWVRYAVEKLKKNGDSDGILIPPTDIPPGPIVENGVQYGRQTQLNDLSAGTTNYSYDALG